MEITNKKKFYRYEISYRSSGDVLELETFFVIAETKCTYVITDRYGLSTKRIFKKAKKSYAHSTKKDALNNYITRTKNYIEILNRKLKSAEFGLRQAQRLKLIKQDQN